MTSSEVSPAARTFGSAMRATSLVSPLIPIVAIAGVQSSTNRITEAWQFTAAMIHTMSASTFGVILALSMVINALIVATRVQDRPIAILRPTRYPLAQLALMASSIGWVLAVVMSAVTQMPLVPLLAVLTAALSIVVFVFALLADAASRQRRAERLEARRDDPAHAPRRRRIRILVAALAGFLVVAVVLVAVVPQTRTGCTFAGGGQAHGQWSLFSPNCGAIATSVTDPTIEMVSTGTYTVITQGFQLGIWPEPVLLELRPE